MSVIDVEPLRWPQFALIAGHNDPVYNDGEDAVIGWYNTQTLSERRLP